MGKTTLVRDFLNKNIDANVVQGRSLGVKLKASLLALCYQVAGAGAWDGCYRLATAGNAAI